MHLLHAFVNGILQGLYGQNTLLKIQTFMRERWLTFCFQLVDLEMVPFKFKSPVSLKAGKNEIAILSMTVGLQVSYLFSSFNFFVL